jgi:hypothetical protein
MHPLASPEPPGSVVKAIRTVDSVQEVAFVYCIARTETRGDELHVTFEAPQGLLRELPLPFEPPLLAVV